jgi:hypothetical protein
VLPILTELLKNDVRVWVYRYASTASLFQLSTAATGNRNVVVALSTMSL